MEADARLANFLDRTVIFAAPVMRVTDAIAPETLSRILNDQHIHPQFETVARIATAARVRVGWLLEEPFRGIELNEKERATIREAGVILLDAMRR